MKFRNKFEIMIIIRRPCPLSVDKEKTIALCRTSLEDRGEILPTTNAKLLVDVLDLVFLAGVKTHKHLCITSHDSAAVREFLDVPDETYPVVIALTHHHIYYARFLIYLEPGLSDAVDKADQEMIRFTSLLVDFFYFHPQLL